MSGLGLQKKSKKKTEASGCGILVRIAGFILILLAVFPILSLFSYDWHDVPALYSSPDHTPLNLIGLAGAYGAYYLGLLPFGLPAWLIPVWMIVAGFFMLAGKFTKPWRRVVWAFIFQMSVCALFDLSGSEAMRNRLHIPSPPKCASGSSTGVGGALGWLTLWMLCECFKIGTVGAVLVIVFMLVLSLGFGVGWRNWGAFIHGTYMRIRDRRLRYLDERERIEIEQRQLAKKVEAERKAQEREALRAQREAEKEAKLREKEEKNRLVEEERLAMERSREEQRERIRREREAEAHLRETTAVRVEPPAAEPAANGSDVAVAMPAQTDVTGATKYQLPSVDILASVPPGSADYGNVEERQATLISTLKEFKLDVTVENVARGPVVTTFELLPGPGIRPEQIASMAKTLEMRLRATSMRIEAPIPGKCLVGVEIPNKKACTVTVREVLEGSVWREAEKKMALPMILGKDASGKDLVCDLASMPHMLVAGATGSGKSVCINAILTGLLMSRTPDELRLILVDPKVVEFTGYNAIPHLVVPIITDAKKVSLGLIWAIHEMEKRYRMLFAAGVKNISSFNNRQAAVQEDMFETPEESARRLAAKTQLPDKLPYIVIVIDELADLMLQVGREIEDSISRLAAKARAVGIHLVLATQRPTVNVVTGTIKANIPGRIAFQVAARVDSKTILDRIGAESLIGHGDMLFLNPRSSKLVRAQGAFIGDADADCVTEYIRGQGPPRYMQEVQERLDAADTEDDEAESSRRSSSSRSSFNGASSAAGGVSFSDDNDVRGGVSAAEDELYDQALEIVRRTRRASTSSLQRAMRIGYTRAARLIDLMEERGIVGPGRGANAREILVDLDGEIPEHATEPDAEVDVADDHGVDRDDD